MKIARLKLQRYDTIGRRGTENDEYGLYHIIHELKRKYDVEECNISQINQYDFILVGFHSIMAVDDFLFTIKKHKGERNCQILVGGWGCLNVKFYSEFIDIAVFGRAEGQIIDIIEGKEFDNVWRKSDDPDFKKQYQLRQPQYICDGDGDTVGCAKKCYFCAYSWYRKYSNFQGDGSAHYQSAVHSPPSKEDIFTEITLDPSKNRYITGIDGLSEATRFRVNKRISDEDILNKFESFYSYKLFPLYWEFKIYQIIGYPWETQESIMEDFQKFVLLLTQCDKEFRLFNMTIKIQVTPFGAEPLTPMEKCSVQLINWNAILKQYLKSLLYHGKNIRIMLEPYIQSEFVLLRRMFLHRGQPEDLDKYLKILTDKKKTGKYDMNDVPEYVYSELNQPPISYLSTYTQIPSFK